MSDFWLTAAWLVTVFLFLLSAFFSSSETAIMSVNRLRLKSLVDQGDRRASCVDRLLGNSPRLLSGILLGNNFANVTLASLATALAEPVWGDMAPVYVAPTPVVVDAPAWPPPADLAAILVPAHVVRALASGNRRRL